jgi:hypothetical protein
MFPAASFYFGRFNQIFCRFVRKTVENFNGIIIDHQSLKIFKLMRMLWDTNASDEVKNEIFKLI